MYAGLSNVEHPQTTPCLRFPHEIPERGRKVSSRRHVPGKWFTLIEGRGGRGPAVGGGGGEVICDAEHYQVSVYWCMSSCDCAMLSYYLD